MNNIFLDNLKIKYLDSLVELENKCFKIPWSKNMFLGDVDNPNAYYILIINDDRVIGYCGLYMVLDESSITNIAVHPDFRRKGLATLMLRNIFEYCLKASISFVTLEVRESNTDAIKLYMDNGFEIVGERKNYYADNRETAILMTKYLKEV